MKDEIKEILEDIKDMNNYSNFIDSQYGGKNYYYLLEKKESKQLLDYITNLQEYYNDNTNKYEELLVKYSDLQENNQAMQEEMARTWKIADDYKSRIDKAIEWIDYDNMENYFECPKKEMKDLLNILQGEDKE